MKNSKAEILREYGPFEGVDGVHGVTFDGEKVWFCSGGAINAFDPESGKKVRSLPVASNAGTAFDGKHLYQICANEIHKIDPETGRVLHKIPAPGGGNDSGMAWAEGSLWVGQYRERKIRQVDPETGKVLRTIESEPLRHRRHLGRWRAVARHLGKRAERVAAHRSASRARCSRVSRCRQESSCPGSSPMARIASIAAAGRAGRSGR